VNLTARRFLILAFLIPFVGLGILTALPHTHSNLPASAPHDCLICRAQNVHLSTAPQFPSVVPILPQQNLIPQGVPCFSLQTLARPYHDRAPPFPA